MARGANSTLSPEAGPRQNSRAQKARFPRVADTISPKEGEKRLKQLIIDPERLNTTLDRVLKEFSTRYALLDDEGGTRSVYESKGVVLKVPRVHHTGYDDPISAISANLIESALSRTGYGKRAHPVAKTRLLWHSSGIPIIMMEKIDTGLPTSALPRWARGIEKRQVGYSQITENFVVYDASEFPGAMPPSTWSPHLREEESKWPSDALRPTDLLDCLRANKSPWCELLGLWNED